MRAILASSIAKRRFGIGLTVGAIVNLGCAAHAQTARMAGRNRSRGGRAGGRAGGRRGAGVIAGMVVAGAGFEPAMKTL
jgi:hypothetical protein